VTGAGLSNAGLIIAKESLHAAVRDPVSSSMNFLNEVAERFPDAISLAAGRPSEGFYESADVGRYLQIYLDHLAAGGSSAEQVRTLLMQYGRTNGQIHGLIAQMLAKDENIHVAPEAIAVTAGCQEAMVIALRGLFASPDDVLLASSPCYVGITGAARLLDVDVVGVPESSSGVDPPLVAEVARSVRAAGRRPRAFYVAPNFANPSGVCLPVSIRAALLDVARSEELFLLEDDPYGLFGLDDDPRPSLKSLDVHQRVIYLGSFAKTCFPGARVGFLVADQTVRDRSGRLATLAQELSAVKSMLTVNTSAVAQAVIGGMLVEADFSLRASNQAKIAFYRSNLQTLLAALQRHVGSLPGVSWRVPSGGFFVVVTLPMVADEALLEVSAREHGVLWTPMSFFYPDGGGTYAIRLACSALTPDRIEEGVRRLAGLLTARRDSTGCSDKP
jgi:(S)-3,5-dihydroxyphenylglycine transaminase